MPEPFPLQIALIAIFAGVILVLVATILGILFRKRICCPNHDDKDGDKTSGTSTDSSGNHKFDTNPDFHCLKGLRQGQGPTQPQLSYASIWGGVAFLNP